MSCLSGRRSYVEEIKEKIMTGRSRTKKKTRSIQKSTLQVSNELKGRFMEKDMYVKDTTATLL